MIRKLFLFLLTISLMVGLLHSDNFKTAAQDPEPPLPEEHPCQMKDKNKEGQPEGEEGGRMNRDALHLRLPIDELASNPEGNGGPDTFGYTWSDAVPYNWIDATGGVKRVSGDDKTQLLDIGFPFKFYEQVWNQVYVTTNGILIFGTNTSGCCSGQNTPLDRYPNNVIAAFWDDLTVGSPYNSGGIYTLSGGTAPNRYFVVEWYRVTACCTQNATDYKTFEVILHENGDIVIQTEAMTGNNLYRGTTGIEDSDGIDGLAYSVPSPKNNKVVRFYRPPVSARVKLREPWQGGFSGPGGAHEYEVTITNTGDLGSDTYDLAPSSAWPISLHAANGVPLNDTDSDGVLDTGPVIQGSKTKVLVRVQVPDGATVGSNSGSNLTITSSLNTGKNRIANFKTAVPAPFAQVFRDDRDGAMSMHLVQPADHALVKASPNYQYGYDLAVAETPAANLVYAWSEWRCKNYECNSSVDEIYYTVMDARGNPVKAITRLANLTTSAYTTRDFSPAVAASPNGNVILAWYRYQYQYLNNNSYYNYNIFYSLIDQNGKVLVPPTNLTNNSAWGTYSVEGYSQFYSPHVAATGDSNYMISWQYYLNKSNVYDEDLYYAVVAPNGSVVKGATRSGGPNARYHHNLASLNNNRFLLVYYLRDTGLHYMVFNSSGVQVKPETSLNRLAWAPDAVQLSNGRILLAYSVWIGDHPRIEFQILDGSSYTKLAGPTSLESPGARFGENFVSVTADKNGRGILTWMDDDWRHRPNLYYALVNSDGIVLTPGMIFYTAQPDYYGDRELETNFEGNGNTSYSWIPPAGVDGWIKAPAPAGTRSGPQAAIPITFGNDGTTQSKGVVVTAILEGGLTYHSDSSGFTPMIIGNTITWNLPDLSFLSKRFFNLSVNVPAGGLGQKFPVTLQIASAGPEDNAGNNEFKLDVEISRRIFLPIARH